MKAVLFTLLAGLLGGVFPLPGLQAQPRPDRPSSVYQGPVDAGELEAFLDPVLKQILKENGIPGAVFVLVRDGNILLAKGYGLADLERKTPMDPAETLFRVGSVSKLFTSTAVMQLVDQGKVDPGADVNAYFKSFQIENRYPRPIRVEDLLMHTHGLDVLWYIGWFSRHPSGLKPLGEFLKNRLPRQVYPPGEVYLYSNVGMALAGALIEDVGGEPFPRYMATHVFQPLGLRHTSFEQVLPGHLAARLAVGYELLGETRKPVPFTYFNTISSDGLSTTALDVARFMIAHLEGGRYGDATLLSPQAVAEMHARRFAYHPDMPASAYGFWGGLVNGQRVLQHGGAVPGYLSLASLLPDQGLGYFVAVNGHGGDHEVLTRVEQAFMDHYYPDAGRVPVQTVAQPGPTDAPRYAALAGYYQNDMYSRHTLEKLGLLVDWAPAVHIVPGRGDTLRLYPEQSTWTAVGPLAFKRVDRNDYLAFVQEDGGRNTYMIRDDDVSRYRKLARHENVGFQWKLIGCFFGAFLFVLLSGAAAYLVRRFRKSGPQKAGLALAVPALISLLNLAFLVGVGAFFARADNWTFVYGMPLALKLLLVLPLVSGLLTLALPVLGYLVWRRRQGFLPERLVYTSAIGLAFAFLVFLDYWNLLGFKF